MLPPLPISTNTSPPSRMVRISTRVSGEVQRRGDRTSYPQAPASHRTDRLFALWEGYRRIQTISPPSTTNWMAINGKTPRYIRVVEISGGVTPLR